MVPAAARWFTSEHDSWLNCTPNSGPDGWLFSPGLKFCWMIWLAVRVVNALPSDDRYAPVTAFAIAASSDGNPLMPSSPPVAPVPDVIVNVGAAPFIRNTPS